MLPITFTEQPDLASTRILMINGSNDQIMDHGRVDKLAAFFKDHGADTASHWIAAGHPLSSDDISLTASWLAS